MAAARVSPKVKTATIGAGAGAVVGEFVNWLVDSYLLTPGVEDGNPAPVSAFILLVCSAGLAAAAGYIKPDDRSVVGNGQD